MTITLSPISLQCFWARISLADEVFANGECQKQLLEEGRWGLGFISEKEPSKGPLEILGIPFKGAL